MGGRGGSRASTVTSGERGAVTAEAAAVVPVLVALALGLVWMITLAAAQVRMVDAVREVARVAARGQSDPEAAAHGDRAAPAGTTFQVRRGDGIVEVSGSAEVDGPGGILAFLPGVTVRAHAVAAEEPR